MITKVLVNATAMSASETVNSSVETIHMAKGNRGLVCYKVASYSGSGNVTCKLQGRTNPDMDWVEVDNSSKNISSSTADAVEDIQLFPEMRATVTTAAGTTGTVSVHLGA